jgi:hypothetical protein
MLGCKKPRIGEFFMETAIDIDNRIRGNQLFAISESIQYWMVKIELQQKADIERQNGINNR